MVSRKQWSLKILLAIFFVWTVQAQNILEVVGNLTNLTTLNAALSAAPSITELLSNESNELTLFAPDDSAFNTTSQAYVADLVGGKYEPQLNCFLLFHIINIKIKSQAITGSISIVDAEGEVRLLSNVNNTFNLNSMVVTTPDVSATNGVVQVISASPLSPKCVTTSIYNEGMNIDSISVFLHLVSKAGYTNMLNSSRPLTVLAPTNDAFEQDILAILLFNGTALNETVTRHFIDQNVFLNQNETVGELNTVQGENVTFDNDGDGYTVNNATLSSVNSVASNGILHVIDSVLLPESLGLIDCGDFKVKNAYYLCGPTTACVAGRTSCTIAVTGDACVCACLPGKEGPFCLDIDECKQDPPICPENAFCVDYDTPERYKCGCSESYTAVLATNDSEIQSFYGSVEAVLKEWRPLACV